MASIDIKVDYDKIQKSVESYKAYKDLKKQYDKVSKKTTDIFEQKSSKIKQKIDSISGKTKSFQKKVKSQFDHLLDVNETTGSHSVRYVKRKFIEALKELEPKISEILLEQATLAIGCDQQQTFVSDVPIYIKVSSVDLAGLLKISPDDKAGKLLYEKTPLSVQSQPFAMNKELYRVTQTTNSYQVEHSQFYLGSSEQNLLDIQYVETHPTTGVGGGWFKVTPKARIASINLVDTNQNLVGQFIQDYYKTIRVFDKHNVITWTLDFMTGAISIKKKDSDAQISDKHWLVLFVQRVLGLCFDNRTQIDVSGNAKVSPSDGVDNSFFELSDVDLRYIDQTISNVKSGVFEFEDCENVKIPVATDDILNELDKLTYVEDKDFNKIADGLPESILPPPGGDIPTPGFDIFDKEFITQVLNGLVASLFSPKILLPIYTMIEAIGNKVDSTINNFETFFKNFREFAIGFISKVCSLFIKILFNIIKRDIMNLILSIISDISIEVSKKRQKMILKLVKIFLVIAELYKLVTDWRKCKSVVDEILRLIQLWQTRKSPISGGSIPFPILYAARLLDGYSETRAFIGTIEELQKVGIPTGAMPDGSPNLTVLSMFSQLKAAANEENENGKVQVALGPLTVTPAGFTVPSDAFGKKM